MENKNVKCKPGQGKLNRLIAKAQDQLQALGYPKKRFKRNYSSGTAQYTCPVTKATVYVNIETKEISGDALAVPFINVQNGDQNAKT